MHTKILTLPRCKEIMSLSEILHCSNIDNYSAHFIAWWVNTLVFYNPPSTTQMLLNVPVFGFWKNRIHPRWEGGGVCILRCSQYCCEPAVRVAVGSSSCCYLCRHCAVGQTVTITTNFICSCVSDVLKITVTLYVLYYLIQLQQTKFLSVVHYLTYRLRADGALDWTVGLKIIIY